MLMKQKKKVSSPEGSFRSDAAARSENAMFCTESDAFHAESGQSPRRAKAAAAAKRLARGKAAAVGGTSCRPESAAAAGDALRAEADAVGRPLSPEAAVEAAALDAWWAKYGPVEQAIVSARERRRARAADRRRRRAREFGDICEMTEGRAVRWRRDGFFLCEELGCMFLCDAGYYAYLDFMRRESGRSVSKLKAVVRRPGYYAAENARRRALAAERRKVRVRRTENACPTREQVLDAWIARRRSHEDAIRFGSLVEDLECYIDNSLRRDEDGVIVGRNPGVKGWLRENVPALALQYTTVMRYKAAAKTLKQIAELADPTPADVVLPKASPAGAVNPDSPATEERRDYGADEVVDGGSGSLAAESGKPKERSEEQIAAKSVLPAGDGGARGRCAGGIGGGEVPPVAVVRARAIWEEVVKGVGESAAALFARLDALTDPDRIEDANMLAAWREKYANKITERTKKTWWLKRLWKRAG